MLKKILRRNKLLSIALFLVSAAVIGFTGATILHDLYMENTIKTPTVTGEITEDIHGNVKNASFKNTGTADVFLRVAYTESWSCQMDKGTAEEKTVLLPNTGMLKTGGSPVPMAQPVWEWSGKRPEASDWYVGNDGWLYYKHVLSPNQSTGHIVTSVDFTNVLQAEDERYREANYQLHFIMEVVQCSEQPNVSTEAVKQVFGRNIVLNSQWPEQKTFQWEEQ